MWIDQQQRMWVFSTSKMDLTFYAQKEIDRECIGPGNGTIELLENSTLEVPFFSREFL